MEMEKDARPWCPAVRALHPLIDALCYISPSLHLNNSKEAKLLKTMKFPPSFATPLDLSAVNWDAVRPWVAGRVTALLGGVEDDVLIEYLMEQLQGKEV